MEVWKSIVGFERYEVSSMGNIRRGVKILKPCLDSYGYRQINLYKDKSRYTRKVYRVLMEAFNPNVENKPQIDHINRNRSDDRLDNLRWVTSSENVRNSKGFTEELLGISWNEKNSSYIVRLNIEGKETYFGSCETLEEAKKLRDDALGGHITFIPNCERDSYGISFLKTRGFYQVRVKGKTVGYKKTFDEAKSLRDSKLTE